MRKAYTFRSTAMMEQSMTQLMYEWNLDRTSVIKLALYLFTIHIHKSTLSRNDLHGLVREIETLAPPGFPDYGTFAE